MRARAGWMGWGKVGGDGTGKVLELGKGSGRATALRGEKGPKSLQGLRRLLVGRSHEEATVAGRRDKRCGRTARQERLVELESGRFRRYG
jgi:hypothetical protein